MCNKNIWKVEPLFTQAQNSSARNEGQDCLYAIVNSSLGSAFITKSKELALCLVQKLNEEELQGLFPIVLMDPISILELNQNYPQNEIFQYKGKLYKTIEDCKSINGIK